MNLAEMRARLAAILEERRALHAEAGEGALNDEQTARWDALDTEETELTARVAEGVEAEARAARVADSRSRFGANVMGDRRADPTEGVTFRSSLAMERGDLQSRALRLLDDGRENVRHLEDLAVDNPGQFGTGDIRAKLQRMVRTRTADFDGDGFARMLLLSESPAYRSAFQKRCSGALYFTPEEARAMDEFAQLRAAMSLSDAAGGYGVPVLIDPTIIWTAQGHPNDFLSISDVQQITNDEWKGVTSAGFTAYWTSEGTATTEGNPTLAQPTVTTKKLTVYAPFSIEIGGDYPSFASAMLAGIDLVWQEELVSKFTNGLGTTAQPYGIITRLEATVGSQVASADSGSATAADVYNMWAALPIKYRRNSRWMANTAIENIIRQAGTTDPNFVANLTAGGIPSLFARPFHENDYMDGVVATTSDSSPLVLGDFKSFLIAQRVGMTVETIQHVIDTTTGTPTGQRALYVWGRVGSDIVNTNGMRVLSQT
jgi:HK97 family phage major capsid protein